ncbi:dTDP-4-dehydrorhamnose reductase [Halalkalibacter alkalisediminis]|uniref:dTDP-4-dehydrorhamnose reductase n=1 Tax=Halalkalibacter alkalisediminis TaxID=935616 RepID=A0ABV6NNF1_9BACI|nr:dTDP-4-dehydrorhamnose reductase [Halalkalibacter alkalisediminis]
MKCLITGGNGQLGRALFETMKTSNEVILLPKEKLDITNEQTVENVFKRYCPEFVFHTAAYTAVDQCEKDQVKAFQVNSIGALNIAKVCKKIGSTMIYISSDYVFDGKNTIPYLETDIPNPQSIYGTSKWLGEELVLKTISESYIVRTSWLYGHGGKNFVNTMARFAVSQKEVKVVSDQIGSPTYVNDLVNVLLQLIDKPYGIYHVSNDGQCSWYQFAKVIYEYVGTDPNLVQPITTKEYGAAAKRPAFSLLNLNKLESNDVLKPRNWKAALEEYFVKERLHD